MQSKRGFSRTRFLSLLPLPIATPSLVSGGEYALCEPRTVLDGGCKCPSNIDTEVKRIPPAATQFRGLAFSLPVLHPPPARTSCGGSGFPQLPGVRLRGPPGCSLGCGAEDSQAEKLFFFQKICPNIWPRQPLTQLQDNLLWYEPTSSCGNAISRRRRPCVLFFNKRSPWRRPIIQADLDNCKLEREKDQHTLSTRYSSHLRAHPLTHLRWTLTTSPADRPKESPRGRTFRRTFSLDYVSSSQVFGAFCEQASIHTLCAEPLIAAASAPSWLRAIPPSNFGETPSCSFKRSQHPRSCCMAALTTAAMRISATTALPTATAM